MKAESYKIDSAKAYASVKKTLSKKNQPNKIMCLLMNAMESYRQARKYGWSRPWNKYHLTVFQSFRLRFSEDNALLDQLAQLIRQKIVMPDSAQRFAEELVADDKHLMGYLFFHDYQDPEEEQNYEGVTFSLGRIKDKRFRDRVDVIFESAVKDGRSQGLSRIRVYIDPYLGVKEPVWSGSLTENLATANDLFEQLANCSWLWAENSGRIWKHWTSDYIDYFGPRHERLEFSYFYQQDKPTGKTDIDEIEKHRVPGRAA